ncbi:putative secreted protein (Por secretion system target) [Mariniflexile fucanivorans]|uniref:Putative secreted protein (Por secretion system target) n=1 Tax=Mariniflexile fucanivorans TaxID=264023 RepID=A0A4R1RE73_9FLAO|nr:T9SS type A sorting domain-containing protein [Mariniflexile fucanivorans]TCL63930.1 putative secreted protein (Por secretion system target) [Mariniflexile fucanivorans]
MHVLKSTITLFLFFIFLLIGWSIFAQNEPLSCGTITSQKNIDFYNSIKPQLKNFEQSFTQKQASKSKFQTKFINSIPIKAHVIRNSNGTGGICEATINTAIANLNSIYADAFMEFFLCDGINYLDDDSLCHFKKGDEKTLIETNNVSGLINIYFTDYLVNYSDESICGYTDNEGRNDVIVLKNSCVTNDSTLAHEIGHFFSLVHTHGPDDAQSTELVDGSNCDTDGDGICDTPADPKLTTKNVNNFCQYIGTETDAKGAAYKPDVNNIMSYAMKGCRTHFTQQQLSRMYAFYLTAKNYLASPTFNANFTADVSQTCDETLTVNFESHCENITKWEWDINSDGVVDYTSKNPTHTFTTGVYDVTLTISNQNRSVRKTYSKFIKVGDVESLFNEDFDSYNLQNEINWTMRDVTQNGYNWLLNKGQTASINTGPSLLKTANNQTNTYMYAEASGAKEGDIAELISPCIDVYNPNSELEFSYHMFGKGIGELHIDIKTEDGYINDVIPALIGSHQMSEDDPFLIENIDLSSYVNQTINVRFRAVRGSNWDGDIAIDNVYFKTIDIPITNNSVKVYPNPMRGSTIYVDFSNPQNTVNYSITDLTGNIIVTGNLSDNKIDMGEISAGMYLLTMRSKDATVIKKIIK